MFKLLEYFGRFQAFRTVVGRMPGLLKAALFIVALPGLVGIALSILAFLVSVLALFLMMWPVLALHRLLFGADTAEQTQVVAESMDEEGNVTVQDVRVVETPELSDRPRRQVDVTIIE